MKYKLIKEYPGSNKLGDIANENIIILNRLKDYPEFWEPIVEKNYEILSLKRLDDNSITFINENCTVIDLFLINMPKNKLSIHSIKRLSDGEIFTIGDKISPSWNNTTWNITKFDTKSKDGTLCVTFGGNVCRCSINDIKKPKQPLFTTEDGVDIFKENEIWWIVYIPGYTGNKPSWKVYDSSGNLQIWLHDKCIKRFSTKEKAEEYILLNKPVLSLNDVKRNMDLHHNLKLKDLTNIVKSKIQQSV